MVLALTKSHFTTGSWPSAKPQFRMTASRFMLSFLVGVTRSDPPGQLHSSLWPLHAYCEAQAISRSATRDVFILLEVGQPRRIQEARDPVIGLLSDGDYPNPHHLDATQSILCDHGRRRWTLHRTVHRVLMHAAASEVRVAPDSVCNDPEHLVGSSTPVRQSTGGLTTAGLRRRVRLRRVVTRVIHRLALSYNIADPPERMIFR